MLKKNRWIFIAGLIAGLAVVALWGIPRLKPHSFYGTVMQSPDEAPDFTLQSSAGGTLSLEDFRGKVTLLYFGYTFCPDVCPATLAEVSKAMDILGDDAEKVQLIMISVDPRRDTPAALNEYVAHFHPSFIGATGSEEEIAKIATLYGVFYEKHEGTEATGYLVDHTATVMVIDQNGHLKLIFPFGAPADEIAKDLAYILK